MVQPRNARWRLSVTHSHAVLDRGVDELFAPWSGGVARCEGDELGNCGCWVRIVVKRDAEDSGREGVRSRSRVHEAVLRSVGLIGQGDLVSSAREDNETPAVTLIRPSYRVRIPA